MNTAHLTFEALVNAWSADLYRYAYWLCRDRQLAEDLVQETFMRAWRALDQLQNPQAARAWLIRILRRELSRYLSKNEAELVSIENLPETLDALQLPSGLDKLDSWVLEQALIALPTIYREPLLLQVIAGYSCEEIATILDISSGAVMTRVCRARMQLRQMLQDEDKQLQRVKP